MGVYKVLEQLLTKREGEEIATDVFSCFDIPARVPRKDGD